MAIFRDRPELHIARRLQRRARWVGTKIIAVINIRATTVGVEVLQQGDPNIRATTSGAEVLQQGNPNIRATSVGVEVLMVVGTPPITTLYVPHIYEDYI